jgi:hypothetical protein
MEVEADAPRVEPLESPRNSPSPTTENLKALVDSEDEGDAGPRIDTESEKGESDSGNQSQSKPALKKGTRLRVLSSDSDSDNENGKGRRSPDKAFEEETSKSPARPGGWSALIDSEDELVNIDETQTQTQPKVRRVISSDSDSSDSSSKSGMRRGSRSSAKTASPSPTKSRSPKGWKALVDSEDEEELLPLDGEFANSNQTRIRRSPNPTSDSNSNDSGSRRKSTPAQKQKPVKKLTKKQRDELRLEIASKTQRMVREAPVSLPYHKPQAPQTLSEFLERRSRTKAEFYNELEQSNTLNLKKLGLPPRPAMAVSDWISSSSAKDKEEPEFAVEDLHLVEDGDEDGGDTSAAAVTPDKKKELVKKKLFDEEEVLTVDLEKDKEEVLTVEEPNKAQLEPQEQKDVMEFETDSELEEEFEMVNIAESYDEKSKPKEVIPIPSVADPIPPVEKSPADKPVETKIDESEGMDTKVKAGDGVPETDEPEPVIPPSTSTSLQDEFQAKEDELNEYLNANGPPRKSKLSELIKSLPQSMLNAKPSIDCGLKGSSGFIDFSSKKPKPKKGSTGIQTLMDRFIKHAAVLKKPREQHFNVR